jgi:2-haloacid dehalogenase
MSGALAGTEICVFDAYGTLFDFNSAVARHRAAIGPKADALSDMWRSKQIQYTWLRNGMGAYAKFWQVTGEALDHCLAAHGIEDRGVRDKLRVKLMGAYLALAPFPEVPAMLDRLKRAGVRLAILSNGNPEMLDPMVAACGLADRFEAVLSVDAAHVFKPDPRVYRLVEARCGVKPDKVCFLSSNCWDAHGAAHFGFSTVWVNRAGAPDDNLPGALAGQIRDLSHLPALLGVS